MPPAAEIPHFDEIILLAQTEQVPAGVPTAWDLDVIAAAGLGMTATNRKKSEVKTGETQDVSTN